MSALWLLLTVGYAAAGIAVVKVMSRPEDDGDSPEPWDPAALAGVLVFWPVLAVFAVLAAVWAVVLWVASGVGRVASRLLQVDVRR